MQADVILVAAERRFIDQAATGAVDDEDALLGLLQVLFRQDVAGLVGERRVQGDEVGAGQQVFQLQLLDAHFHGEAGDVIEAQALEVLGEKAELVGSWLGGAGGRETCGGE